MAAGSLRWFSRSAAVCRLARFNATMDDPNKPAYAANYFTGVPAPAGAIAVLLPIYLAFLGLPKPPAMLTAFYTLLIGFLMVSRLPVFSGKTVRMRVPPEMVLPVFVSVVFFIALLIGYPWVYSFRRHRGFSPELAGGLEILPRPSAQGCRAVGDAYSSRTCGNGRALRVDGRRHPAGRSAGAPELTSQEQETRRAGLRNRWPLGTGFCRLRRRRLYG